MTRGYFAGSLRVTRQILPLLAPKSRVVMVSSRSAEIARFGRDLGEAEDQESEREERRERKLSIQEVWSW